MKQEIITLDPFEIIGLKARTITKDEFDPSTAKIAPLVKTYWQEQIPEKITNRKNLGVIISSFSNYESDYTGAYDYVLGEEVWGQEKAPEGLSSLMIQGGTYVKFTSSPGPMPDVVIEMWQAIWKMSPAELGGTRVYKTDFEIYDERAQDPENTIVDIYIGIQPA